MKTLTPEERVAVLDEVSRLIGETGRLLDRATRGTAAEGQVNFPALNHIEEDLPRLALLIWPLEESDD